MKHWTEPNGHFILNIPLDWQFQNSFANGNRVKPPYSFQLYHNPIGCLQISSYLKSQLKDKVKLPIQRCNKKLFWEKSYISDQQKRIKAMIFHANVEDLICFVKYIYTEKDENNVNHKEQLLKLNEVLSTIRVIPKKDRKYAIKLNKHDNFLESLCASYDILDNAIKSESYIEAVIILANQIDAFLRDSIILNDQILNRSNDFDERLIFQHDD